VWEEDLQISRQAPRITRRGIKQHIIKNASIMKEGESISKGMTIAGQKIGKSITRNCSGSLRTSRRVIWKTLQDHWMLYQKIHHYKGDRTQRPRKKNVGRATKTTGR
jgi:hypothetical protein